MIEQIVADFGGLNILVNNAGLAIRKPFKDTTPAEWRSQIDVNLLGAIQLCHAAGPHLEKGGNGQIIAIVATPRGSANRDFPSSAPPGPALSS